MAQLAEMQEAIMKNQPDLESRAGASCSRLEFFESELKSLRKVTKEQHEQLKMTTEIVRAHEQRFGSLDSDDKALQCSVEGASASQSRNAVEQEAVRKMANEIGRSNEERIAEVTNAQNRLRESIGTIVRDELKKLKMDERAAPADRPRLQHFPFLMIH
jgi:hypothetical protein